MHNGYVAGKLLIQGYRALRMSQSERLNGAFAQLFLFEELRMAPFGPPVEKRLE